MSIIRFEIVFIEKFSLIYFYILSLTISIDNIKNYEIIVTTVPTIIKFFQLLSMLILLYFFVSDCFQFLQIDILMNIHNNVFSKNICVSINVESKLIIIK